MSRSEECNADFLSEMQAKASSSLQDIQKIAMDLDAKISNLNAGLNTFISTSFQASSAAIADQMQEMYLKIKADSNLSYQKLADRLDAQISIICKESSELAIQSRQNLDVLLEKFDGGIGNVIYASEAAEANITSAIKDVVNSCDTSNQTQFSAIKSQLTHQNIFLRRLVDMSHKTQTLNTASTSKDLIPRGSQGNNLSTGEALKIFIDAFVDLMRTSISALIFKIFLAFAMLKYASRACRAIQWSPSMLLQDSIRFEDILGRITYLPYAHFRHYPVFMAR